MAQLQFRSRCQNFLHASRRRPSPRRRSFASGQGGAARPPSLPPPVLSPYWQNMGIGFGPNLIPSGKLACQPARQREERRPSVELRPAVGQNANGAAEREQDGLETADLCRAILAASTAIGSRAEHTNFISTTLQRNRKVGREVGLARPRPSSQRSEQIPWSQASSSRAQSARGQRYFRVVFLYLWLPLRMVLY